MCSTQPDQLANDWSTVGPDWRTKRLGHSWSLGNFGYFGTLSASPTLPKKKTEHPPGHSKRSHHRPYTVGTWKNNWPVGMGQIWAQNLNSPYKKKENANSNNALFPWIQRGKSHSKMSRVSSSVLTRNLLSLRDLLEAHALCEKTR